MNDNDYLPDEALAKIEALIPKMAQDFTLDLNNVWAKSAQVLFKWHQPGDVFERADSITNLVEGAMCVDTLCKNLRAERERQAVDLAGVIAKALDDDKILVPRSFVESVLYSGAFEGEDLDRLHRQAEKLLDG